MLQKRPTVEDAQKAVRTLIEFIGEDPEREGLRETPKRFVKAYQEMFQGYQEDPGEVLNKTFDEIEYPDEMVLVKGIKIVSFCEHHILPIIGKAHVAYIPDKKVVGISKLARVVDIFSKRLQTQEVMTRQLLETIDSKLQPKGIAILISASHFCMSIRGAQQPDSATVTSQFSGRFRADSSLKDEFYRLVQM